MSRLLSSLSRQIRPNVRSFSKGEVRKADPKVVKEIQSRQAAYQASDDQPVHLRSSKMHFYITSAFGVVAFAGTFYNMYEITKV